MRKTILIIGIIIAILIAGVTTVNAGTTTASLSPSSITAKPGDTFKIIMHVNCSDGINAIMGDDSEAGFTFNYDSSKLELVSRKALDPMSNMDEELDTILLVYFGSQTLTNNDVYEWTFKVKSDAQAGTTNFSTSNFKIVSLEDSEEAGTTIQGLNTSITIQDSSTPDPTPSPTPDPDPTPTPDPTPSPTPDSDSDSDSGSNTQPSSNTSNNGSYTAGQSTDGTTAASAGKIIPKAGFAALSGVLIAGFATTGVIAYKRYKELKGIK